MVLGVIGLYLSYKIYSEKRAKKNRGLMTCPIGGNCEHVLFSKYSKIFGIDIEYFGFVYFFFLTIGYSVLLKTASSISLANAFGLLEFFLLVSSLAGVAFSLYLIFVQGFFIKSWCTWCLSLSFVSMMVLIVSSFSFLASIKSGLNISDTLFDYISLILIIRLIAVSIGISSVVISSIMTIKFLKDFRIDEQEDRKINIVNQITWLAILLLIIVNVCVMLISPSFYLSSSDWITQLLILVVLIFNTAIQDLHIQPNLIGIRLDLKSINVFRVFWLRQNAFSAMAISLVSWFMIASVSFFKDSAIANKVSTVETIDDSIEMISYYISIVIIAVVISQVATFLIDKIKVVQNRKKISMNLHKDILIS